MTKRTLSLALIAAACLLTSTPAAAEVRDDGPSLELGLLPPMATILPGVSSAAVSAPLAQIDAPPAMDVGAVDPDMQLAVQGMAKVFTSDGKVSWTVAAPLIVFVLVLIARKYLKGAIPWLSTTGGGYALNVGFSLALAFLNLGLKGGKLDPPTIIGLLFQVGYSFATSYLLHHTQKDAREAIAAKGELAAATITDGDAAAAKLEQLGRGPQA